MNTVDRLRQSIRDLVDLAAHDDGLFVAYQRMLAERRDALERLLLGQGSPQDGLGCGEAPDTPPNTILGPWRPWNQQPTWAAKRARPRGAVGQLHLNGDLDEPDPPYSPSSSPCNARQADPGVEPARAVRS